MIIRKRKTLFVLFLVVIIVFALTSLCFIKVLNKAQSEVSNSKIKIHEYILNELPLVQINYNSKRDFDNVSSTFFKNINTLHTDLSKKQLWDKVRSWVSKTQLYDPGSAYLGTVLNILQTSEIIKADVDPRGTQLKLLLTLEGQQQVVFKPKWYSIDKIVEGPVYAGKDRYGSEILAFYLSAILQKPLTPLATVRNISITKDIVPVATKRLRSTIFNWKSVSCIYGKCFYCNKDDPVCEDENNVLTGAILVNINVTFQNNRSPWQRTYKKGRLASWETQEDYCQLVKPKLSTHRLLDLVDVSIFDFLIQNGDRHHYETLDGNVVLLDNGKGLGNPYIHHLDILAPLYQCCILRNNMWLRLQQLSGGLLKKQLQLIPNILNLVTESHLNAIEHRLNIIYATVQYCKNKNRNIP